MEDDDELDFLNLESTDVLENEDGSVDLLFDSPNEAKETEEHYENLVDMLPEDDLQKIGSDVVDSYVADKESRSEWEQMTLDFIDNLGLIDNGPELFEGACTATHPLILESCIKFQSKVSNELLPSAGPVKTKILGVKSDDIEKRAKRIRDDMNNQVQNVIVEFYPESEKTFFMTSFIGNSFKKKIWDPVKKRICDEMIVDKLYVNNMATSLLNAERITHAYFITPRRMEQLIDSKYYAYYDVEADLMPPGVPETTEFEDRLREIQGISSESKIHDEVYSIVEQHCYLKLNEKTMEIDRESKAKPYVVIVDQASQKVLSVRRNWSENDSEFTRLEWFVHYLFIPTGGFYALGYAHILGNLQKTLTMSMRSLADAGQFANLPAGFKSAAARILKDDGPLSPGTFQDVEIPAIAKLSDVFHPLPFKEPSLALFQLMQELTAVGQKFADSTEQVIADSTNYGPVGTTMALLEASTRFYAAVYKRQYMAQTQELKIIARLISEYETDQYPYVVDLEQEHSRTVDYGETKISILPVSDPNYSSQAQRISKAQVIFDTAIKAPQHHNMREVLREVYKSFEIEDIDKLVASEEKPEKREPVDDVLAAINGQPIAAFKGQDHASHIAVKTAWLQDPANGGSESMAQFQPVILANIREHQFLKYTEELGALQAQNMSIEQAAQRISRLNQIAKEEQEEGSPAMVLAKAEKLKAETAAFKENRESRDARVKQGIDMLDKAIKMESEQNRAQEQGRKLDQSQIQIAINMIKEGLNAEQTNEELKLEEKKLKKDESRKTGTAKND
mgnify:CR=1 FL=1